MGMAQAELSETVHALLRALAELSREQSLLDQDPERTTAPPRPCVTPRAAGPLVSEWPACLAGRVL